MAAKLDEITGRVEGARSKISHMRSRVSVRHQVEEHPWTMMGLSVVAGFTAYRLVHARPVEKAVSRALDSARESAGHAAESARGAAQTAAEKARMGTGAIRERVAEREPTLSRTAFDTVTRAAASSIGAALARALVERVMHGRGRGEFMGERGQEGSYQAVEVAPPTAPRIPHPVERQY